MQLPIKQLSAHLKKNLLPVYLIASDVTLLAQQARDQIIQAAKKQQFSQRNLLSIEPGFDWQSFTVAVSNYSLFSEKTIIDLRNPGTSFNEKGVKSLLQYLNNPSSDHVLLLSTDKLTSAQQRTKWYKAVDKLGACITIWPITLKDLPSWIKQQMNPLGIQADASSIQLLAEYTEGNLLATKQALDKLTLLYPNQSITTQDMMDVLCEQNKFSVFDLTQYALSGDVRHTLKVTHYFKHSGGEATLILWALTKEIRTLLKMKHLINQGHSLSQVTAKEWSSRKPLLQSALRRSSTEQLSRLLRLGQEVDLIIKGISQKNLWDHMSELALGLAGVTCIKTKI